MKNYFKCKISYPFICMPRALITSEKYKGLSNDAKVLYCLFLDRLELSSKRGWADNQGRLYIVYRIRDIAEKLGRKERKAYNVLKELEDASLIERSRQGMGMPNIIYPLQLEGCSTLHAAQTQEKLIQTGTNMDPSVSAAEPMDERVTQSTRLNCVSYTDTPVHEGTAPQAAGNDIVSVPVNPHVAKPEDRTGNISVIHECFAFFQTLCAKYTGQNMEYHDMQIRPAQKAVQEILPDPVMSSYTKTSHTSSDSPVNPCISRPAKYAGLGAKYAGQSPLCQNVQVRPAQKAVQAILRDNNFQKGTVSNDKQLYNQQVTTCQKKTVNYNNINQSIYPSSIHQEKGEQNETIIHELHYDCEKMWQDHKLVSHMIRKKINYDSLIADQPADKGIIDEIVLLMSDVCSGCDEGHRVNGRMIPLQDLRERFMMLGMEHIRYILYCLKHFSKPSRNIRTYLLSCLYNAPATIKSFYASLRDRNIAKGACGNSPFPVTA